MSNKITVLNDWKSEISKLYEQLEDSSKTLFHVSIPVDNLDPLAILECTPKNDFSFYWEKPDDDFAISAFGSALTLDDKVLDREKLFEIINHYRESHHQFGYKKHTLSSPFFVGGMAFSGETHSKKWDEFKQLNLTLPKWVYIKNGQFSLLNIAYISQANDSVDDIIAQIESIITSFKESVLKLAQRSPSFDKIEYFKKSETSYDKWNEGIKSAKHYFVEKDIEKLVLARELEIEANREIEPTRFINKLRENYKSCYNFLVRVNEHKTFLGSTPERLVSFNKNYILTEALAGSISRGTSAKEDSFLENQLLSSEKDLHEHEIVVREIRNRLLPYSDEIQVSDRPSIRKMSNVQHLLTPITAWIKKKTQLLNLFFELHPTPAVGGFPKEKSFNLIQEIEGFDRGWYAAPIGWFSLSGSGDFSVAIRSGLIEDNKATFYAGCGIVPDSDPIKEWEETKLKFIPMLSALEFA